jgi:serine/threonine protein kinase
MAADPSADDDRTVIRPPAPPNAAGADSPTAMDRTLAVGAPPAPPQDSGNGLPVGTYLGEFEITAEIGEGGFGVVYMAYDHSLQRRVALKEYMPSSLAARSTQNLVSVKSERHRETFQAGLKSFINEARLLASFDHPSLVKVYRFWEANGTAYMVMPFYEGKTLKDTLRELAGPPDEPWLRRLLAPLTEALLVIHHEQCYHRDIAPDNVMMLAGSNRPLLLDFGAARRVIGDMTQALTVILKPGYAPVEQYAEIPGMKQGPWTDVYALAAVVYFAILRKTPPPSVGRLLNDTYVPLVQAAAGRYSESFLAAIDRALIVKPEERTQSIEQLREELGLGTSPPGDVYTTQPLPPSAGVPPRPPASAGTVAASRPAAPAPVAAPTAPPAPAAPAARKSGAMIAAGVVALGAAAFGAYSWLAPAPRPAPAPVVAETAPPAAAPASELQVAAPAPAPGAPPGRDAWSEFDRVVQAQTPGFAVTAKAASTTLRVDRDEIKFTVESERDGYLYVFAYGADGELLQLLPDTVSDAQRVKKGQRYRFPTGDGVVLTASDPPGPGRLLVMVTARPRDHRDLQPKQVGTFRIFPVGAEGGALLARHPGPQPALAGRAICPANGACDESYGAAVMQIDVVK